MFVANCSQQQKELTMKFSSVIKHADGRTIPNHVVVDNPRLTKAGFEKAYGGERATPEVAATVHGLPAMASVWRAASGSLFVVYPE